MTSNIIKKFSKKLFDENFIIENIKGDASKRKYYRASSGGESLIIMDSSRERRNFINFLKFSDIFPCNNIKIPKIIKKDLNNNILALEDFGDNLIIKRSNSKNFFEIYEKSIINIIKIQKVRNKKISFYSDEKYFEESSLFIEWVLEIFFSFDITNKDKNKIKKEIIKLINNLSFKRNFLVHRDYHSKNIFYKNKGIIIIDYQDAVYGSPLYDLVSLVNDCYKDINDNNRKKLLNFFRDNFNNFSKNNLSKDELMHNFYLLSVQRHMKASGIFCRLSKKNNRNDYLKYLKRTFNYIITASSNCDNLRTINFFAKEAIYNLNESNNSCGR